MIPRLAEKSLKAFAKEYPVVALTGPRQSGKTTLARYVFKDKPYVSLENPDSRELAQHDPRGFLAKYTGGAVFDEVQRCPHLLSYLQQIVDEAHKPGQYILTGSQQFGLLSGITQSLAGRVALIHLLPFSLHECYVQKRMPGIDHILCTGFYPPVHDKKLRPPVWYANYVQTYIERDVRQMVNVRDLSSFQRFVRLCAGRTGQLLNLSELASDCGITHNTARAWISILEASYIVFLLPPHYRNFNKRIIKTPKLYFHDCGLAAWLLSIQGPEQLETHALRGALFETFIVSEFLKSRLNQGLTSNLYYWRDRTGNEIDLLIEQGGQLRPVEIKSGQTINQDYFKGLQKWIGLAGKAVSAPTLVYGGRQAATHAGITIFPWHDQEYLGKT